MVPAGVVPARVVLGVDLNADLGEGLGPWRMGDDEALLDVVSSANVACGFHAGDPSIMARVCEKAAQRGVTLGAHVSYRDLHGFGRRAMDVAPSALRDDVLYQLAALEGFARAAGTSVRYVKPHGALYHRACDDPEAARAVSAAVAAFDPGMAVLALPGSALLRAAEDAGLGGYAEGYLDRGYDRSGRLVERGLPGAVLADTDTGLIATRAVTIVETGCVTAVDGSNVALRIDSLCAHGDTPGAVAAAVATRRRLEGVGVVIRSFVTSNGAQPSAAHSEPAPDTRDPTTCDSTAPVPSTAVPSPVFPSPVVPSSA